jgi:fatty acid desaturase
MPTSHRIAWPTLAVAAAIYGGFLLLTWYHAALPWWLLAAAGGYVTAWQASLQHETVHGHPFRRRWANRLLGMPGFLLWLPWGVYRDTHLRHHVDSRLTDPLEDPESFYVTPAVWARMGRLGRAWLWAQNTLAGRLILGPVRTVAGFLRAEAALLAGGDRRRRRHWLWHLPGAALVACWTFWVCGVPAWLYLLTFVYPGTALMLLRSYLEHQAAESVGARTAVVEAGPVMSLLYLNNNLHAVHHAAPALPWYALPRAYRARRAQVLAGNGGYRYPSYTRIVARHLFQPKEPPVHPLHASVPDAIRLTGAGVPAQTAPPIAGPAS